MTDEQIEFLKHYIDTRIQFLISRQLNIPLQVNEREMIDYEKRFDACMKGTDS